MVWYGFDDQLSTYRVGDGEFLERIQAAGARE